MFHHIQVYFAMALLTEKYNMLYVQTQLYQSGGKACFLWFLCLKFPKLDSCFA